jgi:hypothetical protein
MSGTKKDFITIALQLYIEYAIRRVIGSKEGLNSLRHARFWSMLVILIYELKT